MNEYNRTIPCQYGFDYNKTVFQTSIISEWDLICGKERLVDLTQIILMTGILIGKHFNSTDPPKFILTRLKRRLRFECPKTDL